MADRRLSASRLLALVFLLVGLSAQRTTVVAAAATGGLLLRRDAHLDHERELSMASATPALAQFSAQVNTSRTGNEEGFHRQQLRGRQRKVRLNSTLHDMKKCTIITGGECFIFGCDDSRGGDLKVECAEGYCLCKPGYCAAYGECVKAPEDDNTDELFKPVTAPLRWATHPEKCVEVSTGHARIMDCGPSPDEFKLPVGPVGMLKWKNNVSMCLSIFTLNNMPGERVGLQPCDIDDARQRLELPNGGTGLLRWDEHPDKCLSVKDGAIVNGNFIEIMPCTGGDRNEQFGTSFQPPPSDLPCTSAAMCEQYKEQSLAAYCMMAPDWPACRRLKQCPPGGCGANGQCVRDRGTCECNSGFAGPLCQEVVPPPQPLGTVMGVPPAAAPIIVMAGPAPGPGPAPAPQAR